MEHIHFSSDALVLEGILDRQPGACGAVITHPHPLYGGDMYNHVVDAMAATYRGHGFTTLRFNFRGVGASGGAFDNGRGEAADVLAAIRYLAGSGIETVHLAGYSFGTWVMAGISSLPDVVQAQIYVAPPVALLHFDTISHIHRLRGVIVGQYDDIAPAAMVEKMLPTWAEDAVFEVVAHGDHFFGSSLSELSAALGRIIEQRV